jgi:hypothetical protein
MRMQVAPRVPVLRSVAGWVVLLVGVALAVLAVVGTAADRAADDDGEVELVNVELLK